MDNIRDAAGTIATGLSRDRAQDRYAGVNINITLWSKITNDDKPEIVSNFEVTYSDKFSCTRRLAKEKLGLANYIKEGWAKTERAMEARTDVTTRSNCSLSMKLHQEAYEMCLSKHLAGSGITVTTSAKLAPELDSYCQCPSHTITGSDLARRGVGIMTQTFGKKGELCASRFMDITRLPLPLEDQIDLTSAGDWFDSDRVAARQRYLDKCNTAIQGIVCKYAESGLGDDNDLQAKSHDCATAIRTMLAADSSFAGLPHVFDQPRFDKERLKPNWRTLKTNKEYMTPYGDESRVSWMPDGDLENSEGSEASRDSDTSRCDSESPEGER